MWDYLYLERFLLQAELVSDLEDSDPTCDPHARAEATPSLRVDPT